ncbi:SMC [Hepatospora eriocheir]|uniref:SMC n=1 Tax=Hepatospora eriocheir TaxID=1081669 RepID=A0A1X0QIH5_9MICR|nr:SMC [Hepatospora eriocheir]
MKSFYIKEIELEGFKCYSDKTVIRNLDKSFTAITGTNGSGKSNIIDGIIFCLDLDTSKSMRVSSLKELINIQRNSCRVSLKMTDGSKEYAISRSLVKNKDNTFTSKFKVNNQNSTKSSVENLCKSLNISNNFVVLQGHITKLINIKPNDLKLLIEETAGTKTYNIEQSKSKQLLEDKEKQLTIVKTHLEQRISPHFDEIMKEKAIYEKNIKIDANREKYKNVLEEIDRNITEIEKSKNIKEIQINLNKFIEEDIELNQITQELEDLYVNKDYNELERNERIGYLESNLNELRNNLNEKLNKKTTYEIKEINNEKIELLTEKEKILNDQIQDDNIKKVDFLNKELIKIELNNNDILGGDSLNNLLQEFYCDNNVNCELEVIKEHKNQTSKKYQEYESLLQCSKNMIDKFTYDVFNDMIYGKVIELFEVKDKKYELAVNTILGGMRNFLVVENDEVASSIINNSKRKVSCFPLNKIINTNLRNSLLDCIFYDQIYDKVMKFIFGKYHIFEDKDEARKYCYANKVHCVTLDGTVYDPRGTMTGGKSNFNNYCTITKKSEYLKVCNKMSELKRQLPVYNYTKFNNLFVKINKLIENKIKINALKDKIVLLENIINNEINPRNELEKVRKELIIAKREFTEYQHLVEKQKKFKANINKTKKQINEYEEELKNLKSIKKSKSNKPTSVLEKRKVELLKSTIEYKSKILEQIKTNNIKTVSVCNSLDDKQLEKYNVLLKVKIQTCNKLIEIDDDFYEKLIKDRNKINKILTEKKGIITMDPSNFELIEKNFNSVKELNGKMEILLKDKKSILDNISKLDLLGHEENRKAFNHINKEIKKFLNYFYKNSDILITEEFEIKVKISSDKYSMLSSLSGGQRSLIALCLIFSMLTFKPAPFYLFDEIDSALDLNYTQFIGEIIQKEFTNTQFLLISLKNNMFDNANKVFRVYMQENLAKVECIKK